MAPNGRSHSDEDHYATAATALACPLSCLFARLLARPTRSLVAQHPHLTLFLPNFGTATNTHNPLLPRARVPDHIGPNTIRVKPALKFSGPISGMWIKCQRNVLGTAKFCPGNLTLPPFSWELSPFKFCPKMLLAIIPLFRRSLLRKWLNASPAPE